MNKNIRGFNPLHKVMLAAAATLVFAGIFIFGFLIYVNSVHADTTEDLLDAVPPGSLSEWTVGDTGGNPIFTYEEITSPFDDSTAIKTSVVGSTIMMCPSQYLARTYQWGGNTSYTDLQAYLAFTSSLDEYNFPYVVVEVFDENDNRVGYQVYYGKGMVGDYYAGIIAADLSHYTELAVTEGDVTLDLSTIGSDITFQYFKVTLSNYACVGVNSLTFDHLRILNGTPSVILPTGNVDVGLHYGEAIGTAIPTYVSINSSDSPIEKVCLWLGDGTKNLFDPAPCKTLAEKDWNSNDAMPSFTFSWDSTPFDDGSYSLHAMAVDTAGNEAKLTYNNPVVINNYSLGSTVLPAPITTCAEFQAINQHQGWHYAVQNNIDCTASKNWNGGRGFVPIGEFAGVLDGQNFNITKLFLNSDDHGGGIFADNSGQILRLNLRQADVRTDGYGGGLTRYNRGTIHQSSFTGEVECGYQQCGVLAGTNDGTISECWTDAIVTGPNYVGGLAGHSYGGVIRDSYAKGEVSARTQSGGAVGLNDAGVSEIYSVGAVTTESNNGGLIGWMYDHGSQARSYWDIETSGLDIMCGQSGSTCDDTLGTSTLAMKNSATFTGWDFEDTWAINPLKNEGYPYLRWQTSFTEGDVITPEPEPEPEVIDEPASGGGGGSATRVGHRRPLQTPAPQGLVLGTQVMSQLEQMRQLRLQLIKILTLYIELLKKNQL